jgi:hypothetical protein
VKATINEFPILASSEVSWTLKQGIRPNVQGFDMVPAHAASLEAIRGPVTLTLGEDKYQFLYVVNVEAGQNPNIRRVVLADRRIWWSYPFVRRVYNLRRNVGAKRIKDPASPPENLSVIPAVWYARWSLKNQAPGAAPAGAVWTPIESLRDIIARASSAEKQAFGTAPGVSIAPEVGQKLDALPIEDLLILENGDNALYRLFKYLPGVDVHIDPAGSARFESKASGKEANEVKKGGPTLTIDGDYKLVSNRRIRPRKVEVFFTPEAEVRFDAVTEGQSVEVDDRFCENVLPIPDFSLEVNGQTLCQGTWITFDQAFTAWGTPPGFTTPLTHDRVQKAMVPFMDLWAGLEISGAMDPNADWAARIAAIQQHYRRTYRISRQWMDRIWKLKAFRIATVDQATGTRAPAIVYSDYAIIPGQRALFNEAKSGRTPKDQSFAINVKGYPLSGELDSRSKAAPAQVVIADHDQGVIHFEYLIDPVRLFEAVLPSMVTMSAAEDQVDTLGRPKFAGPTADITNRGRPICYDSVVSNNRNSIPKMTRNHHAAVILTAIPGGPNDERALYKVTVEPKDVSSLLPTAAQAGLNQAEGPVMQVYVGPAIETARVPWLDKRSRDIERLFGVGGDEKPPDITDIVLNEGPKGGVGAASLQAIARASAARLYASMADRWQGEASVTMNKDLRPVGYLEEVEHTLESDGVARSRLKLPQKIEPFDLFTFLDSSQRMITMKLAEPGGAT